MRTVIIIAVLIKDLKTRYFCDSDYSRSPNKKDCDHGRTPIKTQKYGIFMRNAITVAVLIKKTVIVVAVL